MKKRKDEYEEITMNENKTSKGYWTDEKPKIACIFVARNKNKYGYNLWRFEWQPSYLSWVTIDGYELADSVRDCSADEYLILEILPTRKEMKTNEPKNVTYHNGFKIWQYRY